MIFIIHCLKSVTKNLRLTTKMNYLCIFSSRVTIAKSQQMVVMDKFHNIIEIHSSVLWDWHYSAKYSSHSVWVGGIFHWIMSVPQNIAMDLNNVIFLQVGNLLLKLYRSIDSNIKFWWWIVFRFDLCVFEAALIIVADVVHPNSPDLSLAIATLHKPSRSFTNGVIVNHLDSWFEGFVSEIEIQISER